MSPGTYTVTVTDADNGCTSSTEIEITQDILAPTADITTTSPELTCAITDVTLDASASVTQGTASYEWSTGVFNPSITTTVPGTYTVTVTDADNGCTSTAEVVITQDIQAPTAGIAPGATELTCALTSIDLDASALSLGQGTLSYEWSTGPADTDPVLAVTAPGIYGVTVTDSDNGCTATASVEITQDIQNLLLCGLFN
jgi:hypothetical protein